MSPKPPSSVTSTRFSRWTSAARSGSFAPPTPWSLRVAASWPAALSRSATSIGRFSSTLNLIRFVRAWLRRVHAPGRQHTRLLRESRVR